MTADLVVRLKTLSTPHIADACLRVGVTVRCAPTGLRPIAKGMRFAGPVRPARHVGSVDIFLEALEIAKPGDVLVVDNANRTDEACVGDLVTLEVQQAGLAGIAIWGLHRDTSELLEIGLPFFSMGSMPTGPLRLDARPPDALESVNFGSWTLSPRDYAAGDEDGVIFLEGATLPAVIEVAETIKETERRQATTMREGTSFRRQARFSEYLAERARKPAWGFREHLRSIGGAIEE